MEVYFVLYRSKSKEKITRRTEVDILAASARNNPNEGLTGFLHTYQDHFLQYLEGPHGPLVRKLSKIRKDRRHYNFAILAEGYLEERFFSDWNMGQISEANLSSAGALQDKSWLHPNPDINPLPLLKAFAAHAGALGNISINEE